VVAKQEWFGSINSSVINVSNVVAPRPWIGIVAGLYGMLLTMDWQQPIRFVLLDTEADSHLYHEFVVIPSWSFVTSELLTIRAH